MFLLVQNLCRFGASYSAIESLNVPELPCPFSVPWVSAAHTPAGAKIWDRVVELIEPVHQAVAGCRALAELSSTFFSLQCSDSKA
jgi:hypothetical protein